MIKQFILIFLLLFVPFSKSEAQQKTNSTAQNSTVNQASLANCLTPEKLEELSHMKEKIEALVEKLKDIIQCTSVKNILKAVKDALAQKKTVVNIDTYIKGLGTPPISITPPRYCVKIDGDSIGNFTLNLKSSNIDLREILVDEDYLNQKVDLLFNETASINISNRKKDLLLNYLGIPDAQSNGLLIQLNKIVKTSNLTESQTTELAQKLQDWRLFGGCYTKWILSYFVNQNKKFDFVAQQTYPTPASYVNGKITINVGSMVYDNVGLGEEFFHAYQDMYYSGGINQYVNKGRPNIEFEAKLFWDIVSSRSGNGGTSLAIQDNPIYDKWINDLTHDGTQTPQWEEIQPRYFEFMNIFKVKAPQYDKEVIPTLLPSAMLNVLNNSSCN